MTVFLNFATPDIAQSSGYLSDIARVERELFDDAWDGLAVHSVLGQFGAGVLVACDDDDECDEMLGYCIYQIVFETAEILRIATDSRHQQQGVGGGLLSDFIKLCKDKGAQRILLEVRADNLSAIRLYERHGFYQIDVRKGYYKDEWGAVDAMILEKDLG
ncbi:ribosomal protein S18-alanine N-acetyltransferase [Moraxella bovis]|uniref:Ribosomal-protein-alanine N-acetyltransferase n=1 Tax=Moraxella bovis TaxID=476 RepID=A0A378PQA7_MORBO|nr:ribosomal protein S18-alanine N-acetyltransferase [Moraxella bovis]STY90470.1 ribosomal-protein-alanine N-acetyltransferase [Moraxella bovis]